MPSWRGESSSGVWDAGSAFSQNRGIPLLVWRTLAADGHRGLIAHGVVDGPVALAPDDDPLWVDPAREIAVARQVPVRWWPLKSPVWLEHAPEVLGALRCRGAKGCRWSPRMQTAWDEAARVAGVDLEIAHDDDGSPGQGWRVAVEQRLAVEEAAMNAAKVHYGNGGYYVEDVHLRMPFDLRCTRGSEELHVEVKGTTSGGEHVLRTAGEVHHARNYGYAALFVLTGVRIALDGDDVIVTGDSGPVIIERWAPSDDDLEALTYRYTVPMAR